MKKLTQIEIIREEFESTMLRMARKGTITYNLACITINGKFSRYTDPDTDNAWIGFALGYRVHESKQVEE